GSASSEIPDVVNCCPIFNGGEGTGYSFGLLYEYVYSNSISAIGRLKYQKLGGTLTNNETKSALVNNTPTNALVEHHLFTKFSILGIESLVKIKLTGELSFLGGFDFNIIVNSNYVQYEKLLQPATGNFDNGRRIRFETNGKIKDISIVNSSFIGGLCYDISFDEKNSFIISPEISAAYNFTPAVPNLIWNIHSAKAGLSIKYTPIPKEVRIIPEPIKPPEPKMPAPTQEENKVDFTIKSVVDNNEKDNAEIDIEEFLSTRMNPLLNYVFFDSASSEIPKRYKLINEEKTFNYSIDTLKDKSELETYYEILSIIGKRLQSHPGITIKLIGCNSNDGAEKNNIELSRKRAKNIGDYLTKVWKIKNDRIKIEARNLPEFFSNTSISEGSAENRRIELYSENQVILTPIEINDTINEIKQSEMRFVPESNMNKFLDGKLEIRANKKIIKVLAFSDKMPETIVWDLKNDADIDLMKQSNQLDCKMTIRDLDMKAYTNEKVIKINRIRIRDKRKAKLSDKQINLFSLILYDFDSYSLNEKNMEILNQIKNTLGKNSSITIEGYTDKLGEDEYNMLLSVRRAKAVSDALEFENSKFSGYGETKLLFDNDYPEGRFYCRTVKIRVETPIK
ncbi:MAG: OmpA family protein, partial [Bacteroidetes bacterium]|nr:OmpA family protein [Bacteroidota bacterium]